MNSVMLSSAPGSEIGTNRPTSKDLGRPLTDFPAFSAFGREIMRQKSDSFLFHPFCHHAGFHKARSSWEVRCKSTLFEPSSHPGKSSENKSVTFLLQPFAIFLEDLVKTGSSVLEICLLKYTRSDINRALLAMLQALE